MSAKDQIKQIVDYFKREPQLKDKTDGMAEGLLLGANLADEANERSKDAAETTLAVQEKYKEQILAQDLNPNKDPELVDIRDGNTTAGERIRKFEQDTNRQLAQNTLYNSKLQVTTDNFQRRDDETSDRPAFQRMYDYAKAQGFGRVFITKKLDEYWFDGVPVLLPDSITTESNGATLKMLSGTYDEGVAFFTSRENLAGDSSVFVDYDPEVVTKKDIRFVGTLHLDGNMAEVTCSNPTSTMSGLIAYRIKNLNIEGLSIKNLAGEVGGGYGIIAAYCESVYISKVHIDRTDRQNICIWETLDAHVDISNLKNSYSRDCILVSTNSPVSLQKSECTISNSVLKNENNTGTHVIRFSGESSGVVDDTEVVGSSTIDCIYITDAFYKSVVVKNSRLKKGLYAMRVESDIDKYILFDGNDVTDCINGVRHNAAGGLAIYINSRIKGTLLNPFYLAYAEFQTMSDMDISGGTQVFLQPANTGHYNSNKFRNLTDTSNAVLIAGEVTADTIFALNTMKDNVNNKARILTSGRTLGNIGTIDSTTVTKL